MEKSKFIRDLMKNDSILYRINILDKLGFKTHIDDIDEINEPTNEPIVELVYDLPIDCKIYIELSHQKIPIINSSSCIVDQESAIETFKKMFKLAIQLKKKKLAF